MKSIKYFSILAISVYHCQAQQLPGKGHNFQYNGQYFKPVPSSENDTFPLEEDEKNEPLSHHGQLGDLDLGDAEDFTLLHHMGQGDLDSYWLFKGFVDEAIALDENRTELEKDEEMKLDHLETHFKGVHTMISMPIDRIMQIQHNPLLAKRTEAMKEFKIIGSMAHVFSDVPERLIHVNDLSKKLMRFVLMKAWPLSTLDILVEIPEITPYYRALTDNYLNHNWYGIGMQLAHIALILHEEQKKEIGEEEVALEDQLELDTERAWIDGIDDSVL